MAGAVYPVLLIAAVLAGCVHSQNTCRTPRINYGPIRGKINSVNVCGRLVKVETFWGIPYAKPPLGDLRFNQSHNPENWTEVRRCWVPPKACLQEVDNDIIRSAEDMSEDCLYFNIWRPLCNITDMTTIVWIHGGGLQSGSSAYPLYNGEYLAARECVIVASMNYRLGALGFLDTGKFHANRGLDDVEQALAMISVNLPAFAGDRRKIIIAGSGAGAYLASMFVLHLHRNENRTSIAGFILQSGSPLMTEFHLGLDEAWDAGLQLARDLQCPVTNYTDMLACLRKIDGLELTKAYTKLAARTQRKMVVVGDRDILKETPLTHVRNGEINNIPILVGINRDEGTEILMELFPSDFNPTVTQPPEFSNQRLDEALTRILVKFFKPTYIATIIYRLRRLNVYANILNGRNPTVTLLSAVIRDLVYACPLYAFLEARAKLNLSQNVYMYSFNNVPVSRPLPAWIGATSRTEVPYIFGTSNTYMPADLSPSEAVLSQTMQTMWANFAKFGNPTPGNTVGPQWPPYTPQTRRMMVFTESGQHEVGVFDNTACIFWNGFPSNARSNDSLVG